MLLKLAIRNIRRSVRDYTIYFVTLLLGVALFYAFNSIGSQQIVFDLENSNASEMMFATTNVMMGIFSVVIAFVLGFLVIYANQMLMRRRKREFGMYLTLGMGPVAISAIVLFETVIIGLAALAIGILCGLVLSQLLCFATAALFEIMISDYRFVFSETAFLSTLFCFAIIFLVVAVCNVFIVNRFKLINLLYANEANQKYSVRNPWICLMLFVASIVIIGISYAKLQDSGILDPNVGFWIATGLMLVGSLLFFWSLAGFAVGLITASKRFYLRGLIPFTVRQVASKINTAFVSLWAVSILLFFALTTFSTGMSLVDMFTSDVEKATPYDETIAASMYPVRANWDSFDQYVDAKDEFEESFPETYASGVENRWDIATALMGRMPEWDSLVKEAVQIDKWYMPGVTYGDLVSDPQAIIEQNGLTADGLRNNIICIDRAQYDELLGLLGEPATSAAPDEIILLNNWSVVDNIAEEIIKAQDTMELFGSIYPLFPSIEAIQVMDSAMTDTALTFVIPSSVIEYLREQGMLPMMSYLNIDFQNGSSDEKPFDLALAKAFPVDDGSTYTINGVDRTEMVYASSPWPLTSTYSRAEMVDQARGFRMMITYLALYIGLVFLVSIAAILAIQQLSVAIDSQSRYKMLWKLGCDSKMMSVSMFIQIFIYFLAPLILAASHSFCAVGVIYEEMKAVIPGDFVGPVFMSIGLLTVIYGGYMIITFLLGRGMTKETLRAV